MAQKTGRKHRFIHLLWILPLTLIILSAGFLSLYTTFRSEFDSTVSAKPEAKKLKPGIEKSGGTIIHTYNRTAFGSLNKVSTPSFEYYIIHNDSDTKNHIEILANNLRSLGYAVETTQFTYRNSGCSYYRYSNQPNGLSTCKELTGASNPELFGKTENDGRAYHTLHAHTNDYTVHAESSDQTFSASSNDSWQTEYAEQLHLEPGRVPVGKSILAISIGSRHTISKKSEHQQSHDKTKGVDIITPSIR